MADWATLDRAEPELAAFGAERLNGRIAYLATARKDGAPRVHPVTPIITSGRLFLFMEPTSPKGFDLRRGSGYALHAAVTGGPGRGEFFVRGHGRRIDDAAVRTLAKAGASYTLDDHYALFELEIEGAMSTVYEDDQPVRRRWGTP